MHLLRYAPFGVVLFSAARLACSGSADWTESSPRLGLPPSAQRAAPLRDLECGTGAAPAPFDPMPVPHKETVTSEGTSAAPGELLTGLTTITVRFHVILGNNNVGWVPQEKR